MSEVTTIGLDIAKTVFHAHGADERGRGACSKRLTRAKLLAFFSVQPRCIVALEACGGAHHWARELRALGHDVGLIPPAYVKPFVKRHKNDAVDTEAICEAAQRPSMRFVAVKSEEQHASALVFRTRDLLVLQRTQIINAIRGHLTEYSWVAPKGPAYVSMLIDLLDDDLGASLPPATVSMFRVMLDFLADLDERIAALDKEIAQRAREEETARRLMTIPGINATALMALAPVAETFVKGRDFAAWVGLTPPQHSTGGKQKLGATSKMGGVDAATAPDHRGQRRDHPGHTARDSEGIVVRTDAGAQTAHAGDGSTRQQDGEDRLGPSGEGRNLPSSDGGHGVSQNRH